MTIITFIRYSSISTDLKTNYWTIHTLYLLLMHCDTLEGDSWKSFQQKSALMPYIACCGYISWLLFFMSIHIYNLFFLFVIFLLLQSFFLCCSHMLYALATINVFSINLMSKITVNWRCRNKKLIRCKVVFRPSTAFELYL